MTLDKAKKITQLDIRVISNSKSAIAMGYENGGAVIAGAGRDEKQALQDLVNLNWKRICQIVRHRQKYRCGTCDKPKPLQGHHIKRRSRGRLDTVENVVALCLDCHNGEHS